MSEDELQQEMAFLREVIASVDSNADRMAKFRAALQRVSFIMENVIPGEHAPAVTGLEGADVSTKG